MSHLSSAGHQLLRGLYGFIPYGLILCQCSATFTDSNLRHNFSFWPSSCDFLARDPLGLVLSHGDHLWTFGWGVSGLSLVLRALPKLPLTSSPLGGGGGVEFYTGGKIGLGEMF
jgi:hypothetical protein